MPYTYLPLIGVLDTLETMRKLIALLLFFHSATFACDGQSSSKFFPFAIEGQKLSDGLTEYTVYFPVSDMSESPMYFSGLGVMKKGEYMYYVESIESEAHPDYIEATIFLNAEDLSAITVSGSYNFCDRSGNCLRLCGNVKNFYMDALVGNGE